MKSEDELIARLRDLIESVPVHRRVHSTIGDDAALWQPSRSHRSVVSTDALVENVHFRRETMSMYDVGWRAMAANLSDLAATGARPLLATVALGLSAHDDDEAVLGLYRGMLAVAGEHRCAIVGGDLTRAPALVVSITVVGEVRPSNVKGRAGGKPGDVLAVTGPLGASRAGLHVADNLNMLSTQMQEEALTAHRRPQPRVREGMWLAASANVHAMMDLSDGISTDLARLAARSGCAGVLDGVPVARSAAAMAQSRSEDPQAYALAGGEDYELLVAVEARAFDHLRSRFERRFGRPLLRTGHLRQGSGLWMRKGALEESLAATGWDHLA